MLHICLAFLICFKAQIVYLLQPIVDIFYRSCSEVGRGKKTNYFADNSEVPRDAETAVGQDGGQ